MFSYYRTLEEIIGLENLDTSNIKCMNFMFGKYINLKYINEINNWNVSRM